jgi:hypothetical protein
MSTPLFDYPVGMPDSYYKPEHRFVFDTPGLHTITLLCDEGNNGSMSASFCKDVYVKPSVLGTLASARDTGI